MQLRRALLLMAMILLVTAIVVAIVPPERKQAAGEIAPAPPPPRNGVAAHEMQLRLPPPSRVAGTRLIQGDHVVVTVTTAQAGEAGVIGLTDTAEPGTPASFDLLAPSPGRYPVTFTPDFGRAERIGTIDVAP